MIERVYEISDPIWGTICETLSLYDGIDDYPGLREFVESKFELWGFPGGMFIVDGKEFDLYVEPARRGRWRMRETMLEFFKMMFDRHGSAAAKIHRENLRSIGFAIVSGMISAGLDGNKIILEASNG